MTIVPIPRNEMIDVNDLSVKVNRSWKKKHQQTSETFE